MKRLILVASTAALGLAGCAGTSDTAATAPAPSVAAAPSALAPVPSDALRDAQARLRTLGYYEGPVDGLPGPATSRAIESFQRDRGLVADAQLGPMTVDALRDARVPTATAAAPGSRRAQARRQAAALPIGDPTSVRAVQNRLKQLGYYDGAADGVWGVGTQQAVEQFQRSKGLEVNGELNTRTASAMGIDPASFAPDRLANAGSTVPPGSPSDPLDPAVNRRIQTKLRQLGFYTGGADGIWGARSEQAVQRFQRSRGLDPSGQLTPQTIAALGLDPNNLSESVATAPRVR